MRSPLLVLALSLVAAPVSAEVTAMLPVVAADDAEGSRALVDAAVRGELRRLDGVVLQPQADTERYVSGAVELGIECDPSDSTCAAKLAALCGVPLAIRGRLSRRSGSLYLELVRFQVPSGAPLAISSVPIDEADVVGGTREAVETLYGLRAPPEPEPEPEPESKLAQPDGITPNMMPRPSLLPFVLWTTGASTASLGVLSMAVGGLIGASTMGLGTTPLAAGESVRARRDAITLAQGATVTFWVLGGLLAAGGAGLVAAGFAAPMME